MKISLNTKFNEGPSGGGMKFAILLRDYLIKKGIKVINDLESDDIDVVFHITPFPFLMKKSSSYSFLDAYSYKLKHPKTVIIHRINECDERKGTNYMNKLLIKTAKYSDVLIFIASWLKPLLEKQGLDTSKPNKIILHGGDNKIYNIDGKNFWNGKNKLKIVTHHWGGHFMKGHDFYQRLDSLLSEPKFFDKFEFTYIGNYPKELKYKNTRFIESLSGEMLAGELKKHDVYITASRNEPAGMHHVEGALCGLPILYINSGALKEYCQGYGIEFDQNNFEEKLFEIYNNYEEYKEKIIEYNRTSEKMLSQYYDVIMETYNKRDEFCFKKNFFKLFFYFIYSFFYDKFWRSKNYFSVFQRYLK